MNERIPWYTFLNLHYAIISPQYIDVEDKIVGPFTWKHIGWLLGMCAVLLVMYTTFDFELFLVAGGPTALVFLAFAFYRPSGMPMAKFVFHGFFFLFRPKVSVWERPVHVSNAPTVVMKRPDRQWSSRLGRIT